MAPQKPRYENPPITVEGARTHNLKNLSCKIPAHRITVVTGVSGSGKSSFAFDTLFAEGQRRYVESLSTYARQFIARMPRPDVDRIDNIPPAIALEQKNSVKNARSTIGTATEINDYLRLLFARVGRIICSKTNEEVRRDSPDAAATRVLEVFPEKPLYVVAPIKLEKKTMLDATMKETLRQGFTRVFIDDEVHEIDQPGFKMKRGTDTIRVVVDRLVARADDRSRLVDAVETSYRLTRGACTVRTREGEERTFSEELRCESCPGNCGMVFMEPSVQMLNFSSPLGACQTCQGFGRVAGMDWGKILPNPTLSLNEGVVAPWSGETGQECVADLRRAAKKLGVRMNVPWNEMSDEEQTIVREGSGDWYGIAGYFDWLEQRKYKVQARVQIARFRGYTLCPECNGTRLRREALSIHIAGKTIGELCDYSVKEIARWFEELQLSPTDAEIAERPLEEVRARLGYLLEVGLGYLTLSRQTRTLSGGESQRINLSTALGSALTDTLYVLDEPTVGLHPRDTHRLIGVLQRLKDLDNTVVLVEHDLDIIHAADYLLDIGPAAGEKGGQIIYEGPAKGIANHATSRTAEYLSDNGRKKGTGKAKARSEKFGRKVPTDFITIHGASENNLRHLTVKIPLGVMCCVTGVSGSGKSTLIKKCLYENYCRDVEGDSSAEPGSILRIEGLDKVREVVMVDQSPIGRSTRSNPATYLKAYDAIRELLSSTPDAQVAGLAPRDFSFNVEGGRCEACEGSGYQTIDMHFLADVSVVCDVCEGKRFSDPVLEVKYAGKNVSAILDLTIDDAVEFFAGRNRVLSGLLPLQRVGLGYLRLGQSTATLSGGEAQRLKLAAHIAGAGARRNSLLLFDEPTTGLHPADLDVLLGVFRELLEEGFSLVIIEHNLQLVRQADYVIDMGPEGGEEGGEVVCEGTPEEIAAHPHSLTGKYLRQSIFKPTEALR